MGKVQVLKYRCCGKVFAACVEPECYIDRQWLKDLKRYLKRGDKVEVVDAGDFAFGKCSCIKKTTSPIRQMDLFSAENTLTHATH